MVPGIDREARTCLNRDWLKVKYHTRYRHNLLSQLRI